MKKATPFIACFCMFAANAFAQDTPQETMHLKGRIVDAKTRNDLPGATVQLMTADSVVIGQQVCNQHWWKNEQEGYSANFSFDVPTRSAK